MVGDNPPVDIQGANVSNFVSILVRYSWIYKRTGVFSEGENSKEFPAKYVVNDALEAVNLILKLENLA